MPPRKPPAPERRLESLGKMENNGWTKLGLPSSQSVPAPPPMQIVTKGWWTLREKQMTVDELERSGQ